uniref:THAP domain-containing protein 1 n=1 Tax=Knipowitschia caucasica TaxID=637954 RepID=A0AAV2JJ23_KNICA
MPKSCCAVGCSNHNMMGKKFSFFTFPKHPERWKKWVNSVKRVNPDGSDWRPSKLTVLCSEHFLSGRPSTDPTHPDFIPSIFKHIKTDSKSSESKLRRFAAASKRKLHVPSQTPPKKRFPAELPSLFWN